jgi:hypothetical protein
MIAHPWDGQASRPLSSGLLGAERGVLVRAREKRRGADAFVEACLESGYNRAR